MYTFLEPVKKYSLHPTDQRALGCIIFDTTLTVERRPFECARVPKLIKNPKLFSQHFKLPKSELDREGLLDPILNADTKLFIDPLLLQSSRNDLIRKEGLRLFRERMSQIVSLVLASQNNSDPAWKAALKGLDLDERRETCLGYGGAGTGGSSRPDSLKARILETTREVLNLGISNPEILSLMAIFETDVGADTISDLTTNAIFPVLQKITAEFCKSHSIPIKAIDVGFELLSYRIIHLIRPTDLRSSQRTYCANCR